VHDLQFCAAVISDCSIPAGTANSSLQRMHVAVIILAPDPPEFLASWDNHGICFSACLAHFGNDLVTIRLRP
jgi:hypothetical protein